MDLNDNNFAEEIVDQPLPAVVVFGAAWCAPCKALTVHVEQLAEEFAGRVKVVKADIEKARAASQANNVRGVPTVVAFRGGEVAGMIAAGVTPARLKEFVERHAA